MHKASYLSIYLTSAVSYTRWWWSLMKSHNLFQFMHLLMIWNDTPCNGWPWPVNWRVFFRQWTWPTSVSDLRFMLMTSHFMPRFVFWWGWPWPGSSVFVVGTYSLLVPFQRTGSGPVSISVSRSTSWTWPTVTSHLQYLLIIHKKSKQNII